MKAESRPLPGCPPKLQRLQAPARALVYASALPALQRVARKHGYALAVHGSMASDLDLVAVPWIDNATDAETLIEALRVAVDGRYFPGEAPGETPADGWEGSPSYRPHGRRAWSLYLDPQPGRGTSPYLDISVMPRQCEWGSEAIQHPFFRDPAPPDAP